MFIWTIADLLMVSACGLVALIYVGCRAIDFWKMINCSHEKYFENRVCQAICVKCGLDLGFIGTVREERRRDEALHSTNKETKND